MPIPETTIKLVFRRQDFEEIYFKDGQGSILGTTEAKHGLMMVVLFGTLFFVLLYLHINTINWIMPILAFPIFIVMFYKFVKHILQIIQFRKGIHLYLDNIAKIKKHTLTLTDKALCFTLGDILTITQWVAFTQATITDEYITLTGAEGYTFPKKYMLPSEYDFFKSVVMDKMKGCVGE